MLYGNYACLFTRLTVGHTAALASGSEVAAFQDGHSTQLNSSLLKKTLVYRSLSAMAPAYLAADVRRV